MAKKKATKEEASPKPQKDPLDQWIHNNCSGLDEEVAEVCKAYGNSEEDSAAIARIVMTLFRQEFENRIRNSKRD